MPEQASEEEVPDWLARIRELKARENPGSPLPADEGGIPRWLEDLRDNAPIEFGDESTEKALIEEDEPDDQQQVEVRAGEPPAPVVIPETKTGFSIETDFPASDLSEETNEITPDIPTPAAPEIPSGQAATQEIKTGSETVFPIPVEALPDWLSSETDVVDMINAQAKKPEALVEDQPDAQIEKGLLPAWLKPKKPLKTISSDITQEEPPPPAEERGIFAGISGTLRSLDLEERELKPASNPHELAITPVQQKNADLLYRMLHPESTASVDYEGVTPKKPKKNPIKFVIALIMLLAVFLPFAVRALPVVIPVLYPKEVVDALGFIQELPPGKPVLIAAQFEPGLAGELSWTAEPLLEHLVSRGIPAALLSTNVSGYAILDEQMQRTLASVPGYIYEDQVVNLGYLAGGTVGLISLVNDLRNTVPFSTDLKPAWASTAIADVYTFSDFEAVVLLTDNPEIVRAWVEQTGRAEEPIPLIAVVSAQAAPLVQPYHESGQIRGYVAGAVGAISYQLIRQVPGKASSTFTSYQLAVLTAVLLIFIGGLVSLVGSSKAGIKKKEGRG